MKRQTLLFVGLALIAAVVLLKRNQVTYTPPVTGNQTRDSQVATILNAIAVAGGTIEQIMKAISQFNSMNDSSISSYYSNQVSAGGGAPSYLPDGTPIDYSNYV